MPRSLLQITQDMDALDELLSEVGGDVTDPRVEQTITEWFSTLESDMNAKCDNYAALIVEMEARAEVRKAEAKRLSDRARQDESSAAWLRTMLKAAFEARGMKKVETDRFKISVAANGGKAPLDIRCGTSELPDWAKKTEVLVTPDKDEIRRRLDAGEKLEFATLMERGTRLSIR